MNFRDHSNLKGTHAFLSPSQYSWLNYDTDKVVKTYRGYLARQRGTELHELAAKCIALGVKLPKTNSALNKYVNDVIGFKMEPEVTLFYSPYCYGTADAISFKNSRLRIFDLKTGETEASMKQVKIYAALFCLEYDVDPFEIEAIMRIYQYDGFKEEVAIPEEISRIMDTIMVFDAELKAMEM